FIISKRREFMCETLGWRYFFLSEDSSPNTSRPTAPAHLQIAKTLLWAAVAGASGLRMGHQF
ncbi:MAG TPA: hypothetical protein VKA04_04465, partial [Pseudodesulfovibrio sp.]|nr:hypothetical protein [Pseudodesulfovibrio sp.]